MTPEVTPDEEETWSRMEYAQRLKERNEAAMAAWNAAADFITENSRQLGSITLRQAFEKGFFTGHDFAARNKHK